MVARDHLRAAASHARHFEDALHGGALFFLLEFPVQLIQAHDAHFRVLQRGEVQQVLEFFLVLPLGIRFGGPHDAHSAVSSTPAM